MYDTKSNSFTIFASGQLRKKELTRVSSEQLGCKKYTDSLICYLGTSLRPSDKTLTFLTLERGQPMFHRGEYAFLKVLRSPRMKKLLGLFFLALIDVGEHE